MKTTVGHIRRLINEDMFNLAAHGRQKQIGGGNEGKWKKVGADSRMAATALEKLSHAVMDQDEEAAAKWIQEAQKFLKMSYQSLMPSN